MWGLFSKDPSKDFPYELGERLGHIHLANKTVWTLHAGKHRATGEQVGSTPRTLTTYILHIQYKYMRA